MTTVSARVWRLWLAGGLQTEKSEHKEDVTKAAASTVCSSTAWRHSTWKITLCYGGGKGKGTGHWKINLDTSLFRFVTQVIMCQCQSGSGSYWITHMRIWTDFFVRGRRIGSVWTWQVKGKTQRILKYFISCSRVWTEFAKTKNSYENEKSFSFL